MVLAAGAPPLPLNGDQWHSLREGMFPELPHELPPPFRSLIQVHFYENVFEPPRVAITSLPLTNAFA